jgi:FPC/CPF motif-containing protein YcgG
MTPTATSDWTARVLDHGKLGTSLIDGWKVEAFEQYRAKVRTPEYPCFFGQGAEARGEMLYCFSVKGSHDDLVANLGEFVALIADVRYERSSLVAFFEPDRLIADHACFVAQFWGVLQTLHEHDPHPIVDRTPDDPLWEFSFEQCEMFVVGASPTYQRRRSRNLGSGMVLVFQPRSLFIDPVTSEPIAAATRQRIHRRMLAYDGMPVHPDIGFFGQSTNREWKQYALPDDNEPRTGACPFHSR